MRALDRSVDDRPAAIADPTRHGEVANDPPGAAAPRPEDGTLAAAVELLRAGDFSAAAALLQPLVQRRPNDATACAYLGMARFHLGDVAEAKQLLDQAIELGPREFLAWAKRGEFWLRLGCYPQAAGDLEQALMLEAPSIASRRWVARLLEEAQRRSRTAFVRPTALPVLPSFPPAPSFSLFSALRRLAGRLERSHQACRGLQASRGEIA